jgi:polysaccharide export outer membrane protein
MGYICRLFKDLNRLMRYYLLFVVFIFLVSCVPNKKIVYLQKEDLQKKNLPTDSVVRSYNLHIREYRIQPLDLLYIRIESLTEEDYDFIAKLYPVQSGGSNQQLVNGFLVDNQGEIEFPVAGKIKFGGLSLFEAQEKLTSVFKPYLKNPVARVRLLNFRFTVLGEVTAEQLVIADNTRVTLMEAIGLAGGLTDLADRTKIKIIRQKENTAEVFYVNLLDEELLNTEHYYVKQNDIIVVPPLKQRPFRKYFGQNASIITSAVTMTVSIILLIVTVNNN